MLSDPSFGKSMAAVVGIGWVLVVSVVLGCLLGAWLDRKLNTDPWLLVIGAAAGTTVGILHVWRVSKRDLK
jgi:F0F1-type ATP synthase assembly protein I